MNRTNLINRLVERKMSSNTAKTPICICMARQTTPPNKTALCFAAKKQYCFAQKK